MRKILVSLLVVSMVLGLVGTAFAGYSDAATNKYIDKVSAFGWMNGYPDGTFKPAGNITRAEAAAVIVRALGLSAAADAAKGLGTKFADVPNTHWATGYVNVCTTKGILKGYPDGTFKPEANISNAEIITMIVRALNRESQTVGEWPIGHITVAAAENIIGSGFVSNALATRENVSTYVAKAADVKHLKLTTNGWEEDATKTFVLMNDMELKPVNKDIVINTVDTDDKSINGAFTLVDNYIIAGGIALKDLPGYTANLYTNEDGKVVLVETTSKSTTKTGVLRLVGANYFYLYDDTTKYETVAAPIVTRNGETKALANLAVDDNVEFFRDTAGKVTTVKATVFDASHRIVKSVYTSGDQTTWNLKVDRWNNSATVLAMEAAKTYYLADDATVVLDGKTVTLKDIKEDMVVSIRTTDSGTKAQYIEAKSTVVAGKVTAKRLTTDVYGDPAYYLTVAGVEYRVETNAYADDGSAPGPAAIYNNTKVNDNIKVALSLRGRVGFVVETTGTSNFAKVKSFVEQAGPDTYDKWILDIRGVETIYEVAKNAGGTSYHAALVGSGIAPDTYIKLALDGNGRIDGAVANKTVLAPVVNTGVGVAEPVTWGAPVQQVYTSDRLVKINGGYNSIGDSTVVYVDGMYQTGLAGVAKDNRVKYITNAADPIKLDLIIVDTYAKIDTTKIAATAGYKVAGDNAVEPFSTIEFFTDVAMTKSAGKIVPMVVAGDGGCDKYGDWAAKTLAHADLTEIEETVYVKVIDAFGATTTATMKVYK